MSKVSPKNQAYWRKRFEILEQASNAYAHQTIRKIDPAFTQAERQIDAEITAWYQRFADNNEITMQEARKLLNSKELAELKWDIDTYIKYGEQNAIDGLWMKELENASAKFHISRLEALKLRTQQAAEVAFGNELDEVDGLARKVLTEGYYHTAFEIQKGMGVGWDIGTMDNRKLEKLLSTPWTTDGKTFSDRIWTSKQQLIGEVHNQLTRTCLQGKAPDDAIKNISKKFGVSKSQAGRLVMTEQAYFHSVSQEEAFKELGVEQYEIVATLDSHTSEICQDMDGQHFDMKDYDPGVTAPPFHPWCRSVTCPYFDDDFGSVGERAARDEATGKTYYIPADMTYKEWSNKFVKSSPLEDIRTPVDIAFDTLVSGYKAVEGGCSVRSGGEKYGQETKIVTLNKRNTTEWNELPADTRSQLQFSTMGNKPFYLQKGEYEVQRYVEGSSDVLERDEIAKALGAKYLGFSFQRKNNQHLFIDFYQKGDDVFYSVGKADVKKTIKESSMKEVEKIAAEREKAIIDNIGDANVKNLLIREGDEWSASMKEFHRTIQADGKPSILSDDEYDAIQSPVLYRGIAPKSRLRSDITTSASSTKEMADEFFKGDSPFPSRGVYGDGVAYASPEYKQIAWNYATNGGKQMHGGAIIEFKLKKDARVITYEEALEVFRKMSKKGDSKLLFNPQQSKAYNKEVGKAMNALGYDAIIKHNGDNTGFDFYVILNRSALATKNKYITTAL